MGRTANIILGTVAWCALLAYIIFAANKCSAEQQGVMLSKIEIKVMGRGDNRVVTQEAVETWLRNGEYDFNNIEINKINTEQIRRSLMEKGGVKRVRIYSNMDGVLNIEVEGRNPIARVNTSDGYNFYITDDNWILPMQGLRAVYVPIVTGSFSLPFEKGYLGDVEDIPLSSEKKSVESYSYLLKLINFVKIVSEDSFWSSQIVQINVKNASHSGLRVDGAWKEPEVEIVPRIGKHIVVVGALDDVEEKLEKLQLFYRKVLNHEGWDVYSVVNLSYKGQVVCTK